jgi:hypothetical protein
MCNIPGLGIDARTHGAQEVTTIEETVKGLQRRVYFLSVIIVDKVNVGNDLDEELHARIKDVHSCVRPRRLVGLH